MDTEDHDYTAPAAADIAATQDSQGALRLLIAQRALLCKGEALDLPAVDRV
ncbi:hypothetical protein OSH39_21810 [Mycobacterium ulcerans]|uniref:Uncharacterized protein n=2 Tax=Mycobacterium ulcerans TaxID=1809 RepID=A0PLJ9_MYCUA|nr:hypothetical protein [Mycobacterium ulcerans]ABL03218.1 hypothetical protein MUL_0517 [Mycobacterium ulcerans Agy99]MEB3906837.1 hypothetical protein [Mycobacterium ulcerans]MEB3910977.1 hypothetical protein [Mycobacterium ulcerans]MEB3933625.1 hypothetical protein [Mycobacterium ulcerans]MEB3948019.1 hypothetical protein [Mycobacterium ulcerans]